MLTLKGLLETLQLRLKKKTQRAAESYVRGGSAKLTSNCRHSGPALGGGLRVCKIAAMGQNEKEALTCGDEKARMCPVFRARYTPRQLRQQFHQFNERQLSLRWPSLGELIQIVGMVEANVQCSDEGETELPGSGNDSSIQSGQLHIKLPGAKNGEFCLAGTDQSDANEEAQTILASEKRSDSETVQP